MLKTKIEKILSDMEIVSMAFGIDPFSIFLLGGTACILGDYSTRATMDFDLIDLDYKSNLGRVFALMGDYDLLDYNNTILSPSFKNRAIRLPKFNYLHVFLLSREDIIVSKIIRLASKDIEDIHTLLEKSDILLINRIIDEILLRSDLTKTKKDAFIDKLPLFRSIFNV